MFKPSGNLVLVEPVKKDIGQKLHLPDSVTKTGNMVDIIVRAVGDDVSLYSIGDNVLCPIPGEGQCIRFDFDGNGEKNYVFYEEDMIFGKFDKTN